MNHNKRKKKSVSIVNVFQYGIMFLPMLILFLIFSTYPVIEGVFFSFTDWDGLNSKYFYICFLGDNYSEYMCAGLGISLKSEV